MRPAGLRQRWRVTLAVAIAWLPPLRPAAARLFESAGRLRAAARLVGRSRTVYSGRLAEMTGALERRGLVLPPRPAGREPQPFNRRVVMALYGSEPWFANGYSIRTRCLASQLAEVGIACVAATRPNFPHDNASGRRAPRTEEETFGGICYHRLAAPRSSMMAGPPSAYIEAFAAGLEELVRSSGASVVHAASNHLVGLAACLAAERSGARSVYEIRGLWHWSTAARRPGWEATDTFALHEALERQAALRADRVVVPSRDLADHVRGWGVAAERIAVVANGVDPQAFRPQPRDLALRQALGAGPGTFLVGFIGTFTPYEGIDTLLEAVALLRRRGIDAAAALIGDGEERRRLKRLARRLRVPAAFPGRVAFERVPAYLGTLDAHPFPRRRAGATALVPPLKLAEAMACGVPAVVADLPPLVECVTHEQTGLVYGHGAVALAAALERLRAEPGLAAALGKAGRVWAATHRSWRVTIRPLLAAYGDPTAAPVGAP